MNRPMFVKGIAGAVLIAANLAATVLRFLLFRAWVFPDRRMDHQDARKGPAHELRNDR